MFAATCFGPSGPASGSLCLAFLKLQYCGNGKNTSLHVQQCCGKMCFKLLCVLCGVHCVTEFSHTLHGTQHTPQLETLFTTTLLKM